MAKKTNKKKTAKRPTLHQRMRHDAEKKLDGLLEQACERMSEVVAGTSITHLELMALAGGTQTKVLRARLITAMTNDAEAELERHYNSQHEVVQEEAS